MAVSSAFFVTLIGCMMARWFRLGSGHGRPEPRQPVQPRVWWLAALVTLLCQLPLFRAFSRVLIADAAGHAAIAQSLAIHGAPHGWVDVFNGGFPLGPHYPAVGWIVAAGLIRLGVDTAYAVNSIAVSALFATPFVVLWVARSAGARPFSAVAGAVLISWISAFNDFVGGWGSYFQLGLLSQTIVVPFILGWVGAFLFSKSLWRAPLLAAVSVAIHPQIAVGTMLVASIAVLSTRNTQKLVPWVRSMVAGGVVGVSIFGPGIVSLQVPFGWPPMDSWKLVGFPPKMLILGILDGQLLDAGRVAVTTAIWVSACVILVFRWEKAHCRAALVASVVALFFSVIGGTLRDAGGIFAWSLSFLQPLRVMMTIPWVAGAAIVCAVEEILGSLDAVCSRAPKQALFLRLVPWSAAVLFAGVLLIDRVEFCEEIRTSHLRWIANDNCDEPLPSGFDSVMIRGWLRSVERTSGRFTITKGKPFNNCPAMLGVELASPLPQGRPIGAGAHVGVNHVAFRQIRPDEPDSSSRAESLGVRVLLRSKMGESSAPTGWETIAESGDVVLSRRIGGDDIVGTGCVDLEIRGGNRELHAALLDDLDRDAIVLKDPKSLIRFVPGSGPLSRTPVERNDCDPTGTTVAEKIREPGAYEADVHAPSPVDVVVRASAFPTWSLTVDGVQVKTFPIAPGFFATRVSAGDHHIVAEVSPPRGYLAGILVSFILAAIACLPFARSRPVDPSRENTRQ